MIEDFNSVPVGSVYIAAVMDEGATKLSAEAKEIFASMGSKEIARLGVREGYLFIGIKGSRSHLEKRGGTVNSGLILGYSRVTRRERTSKTVTQNKSYTRTIRRVYKKKVTSTDAMGVTRTRIITRTMRRKVTCHASRKSSSTTTKVTSN